MMKIRRLSIAVFKMVQLLNSRSRIVLICSLLLGLAFIISIIILIEDLMNLLGG